jgi:hypothetical protein
MPHCPNCFFELVLRKHSRKYKCAKCGRLYLQSEIDRKEFIEWNKKEREKDKQALTEKTDEQKHHSEYEKKQARLAYQRKYRKEHREDYNKKKYEYWAKNKSHFQAKRKENYYRQKVKILGQQRLYRENHKILRRINNLRTRQKDLALKYLENGQIKPFKFCFQDELPTFEPSEVLAQA